MIRTNKRLMKAGNDFFSAAIFLILTMVICFFSAKITWQVVNAFTGDNELSILQPNNRASVQNEESINNGKKNTIQKVAEIARVGLFGLATERGVAKGNELNSLPKTKLSLELTGLLASTEQSASLAVIKYQNKQQSFSIGDEIGNTGARVASIMVDGVMIDEAGSLTLLQYPEAKIASNNVKVADNRQSSSVSNQERISPDLKESLISSPQKIFDYLTVTPVKEEDKLVGYRINPGKDPTMFGSLGFLPGDIATEINGIDLRDEQQAIALLQELPTMTQISVNVERDGQIYTINISLEQ